MATIKLSPSRRTIVKTNGNGASKRDFAVRDLSLAEWGRKTIQVSEHEMPGLMSIRKKYCRGGHRHERGNPVRLCHRLSRTRQRVRQHLWHGG